MKPEGLACDWINNNIYWTDSETKRIEVASVHPELKSSIKAEFENRRVLVWEDLDLPRSIAVAPNEGWMFWTDWGEIPKIERAGMNGARRDVIVERDIVWPNGLTLDYENRLLYWVEAKEAMQQIGVVNWEGRGRRIILKSREALPQPFAISLYHSELYWTDWTTK